jgi:hypothetical protein
VTRGLRPAALALAAALAACGNDVATEPGLLLSEPSAVAVYRGLTPRRAGVWPYIAVANASSNDLTLLDALDDQPVLAPVPLRPLVIPVPGRPALLASADLGDSVLDPGNLDPKPDLLVAVSAGSSVLQVIRTWTLGGGVACGDRDPQDPPDPPCVDLGSDVLALVALPPPSPGQARIAAALAGGRIAVVTFGRAGTPDEAIALAGSATTGPLGFQPVALATIPGDGSRVWAASPDLGGVAQIAVDAAGQPAFATVLDARAPTRLVAAARLAERAPGSAVVYQQAGVDPSALVSAFEGQPVEERVYAILDESFCGLDAEIACGLVALDPGSGLLVPDPVPAGTLPQAPFLAPIPIPGRPLALGATPPPVNPPAPADPIFAGTYMRIATNLGARATTGAAAVASSDGNVYYVDLGRWELPSDRLVGANVGATVTSSAVAGQRLVLDPGSAVSVTAGYTPTATWTVTYEGVLPGLASRRAQIRSGPSLALQVGEGDGASEVVRLYDPTLGVSPGDTVVVDVIDPAAPGTCTGQFEVRVAGLVEPATPTPGGAALLEEKDPSNPAWHSCFVDLTSSGTTVPGLRATFRAGGANPYVLVRGTGASAIHVGRPAPGTPFDLTWTDEDAFLGACTLPPAVAWPGTIPCGAGCRTACQDLLRARLARRIGYVPEGGAVDPQGPALAFAFEPESAATPARGLALAIATSEGRVPMAHRDPVGPVNPRQVLPFDRSAFEALSPGSAAGGVRFLVPYASGVVLDATPTDRGSVIPLR